MTLRTCNRQDEGLQLAAYKSITGQDTIDWAYTPPLTKGPRGAEDILSES